MEVEREERWGGEKEAGRKQKGRRWGRGGDEEEGKRKRGRAGGRRRG